MATTLAPPTRFREAEAILRDERNGAVGDYPIAEAELRVWDAEGTANGMRPWITKFGGVLYDRRLVRGWGTLWVLRH